MIACPRCGTTQTYTSENAHCERCGVPLSDMTAVPRSSMPVNEISWEHCEKRGLMSAFFATIRESMFRPTRFFALLTEESSLFNALLFGFLAGSCGILADLVWESAYAAFWEHLSDFGIDFAPENLTATSLLLSPALLAGEIFTVSLYVHTLLLLSRGKHASFKTTVKTICYVQSASILAIFPFVGAIIGPFWSLYILIAGTSVVHKISKFRTALTILTPLLILGILALFIVMVVFGTTVLSSLLLKEMVPFFR